MKRIAAILVLSSLLPAVSLAEAPTISLDAPLESSIGDAIDVIVTVTADAGDEAAVPEQAFAPFEILGKEVAVETSPDAARKTFTFELQLICFDAGEHALGPVHVRITSAAGDLLEIESNAAQIEVRSLLANEPEPELQPPSTPLLIEQDDYRLLIILGALLAIAIGALLTWLFMRWWQRRDRPAPAPPPPPPPWETALAELHALEHGRATAISEDRTEPWVDAVSDSIRAYLGRRFGFHGLESTTDEIADQLERAESLKIAPQEAIRFLGQCDLVKFAKASLAEEASRGLIEEAIALVDRTRPTAQGQGGGVS